MSPFTLQHMPLLADELPAGGTGPDRSPVPREPRPRRPAARAPGVLQPAAGLALVLAGGLFMAVLALPAYVSALRAARAHPDIRAAMAAAIAAEDD